MERISDFSVAFKDNYNLFAGTLVTILSTILGKHWYIFVFFLLFNILDWFTGWAKAYRMKQESSSTGGWGIVKKLGYWAVVLVAFLVPKALMELGDAFLGIDLPFLSLLGWFVMASLMVNEARSILENLVEMGCPVPGVLIRGLAVTDRMINGKAEAVLPDDE